MRRAASSAVSYPGVDAEAAFPHVESGKIVTTKANHWHTLGLQHLQSTWQVEDRLGAAADDRDWAPAKLDKIGRDIEACLRTAMHAADAASGEHSDVGLGGAGHRGGDSCRSQLAAGRDPREVPAADLRNRAVAPREAVDLLRRAADPHAAVDHRDGCRRRTFFPDRRLNCMSNLTVLGLREAVSDNA